MCGAFRNDVGKTESRRARNNGVVSGFAQHRISTLLARACSQPRHDTVYDWVGDTFRQLE